MGMLSKFESKSSRVKGISFHPTRPWVLASLHTGQVQLWDFRLGLLLDTFVLHEADVPVRSVHFHPTQPLFVTGDDDHVIQVWDWRQKRRLFSLTGHLDYIRTVKFHHEYPWIVSASDDQTVRIWNWQSRQALAVLTGHNHYVMCADFHPTQDLVLSASLDQSIRVWDVSGLRKKNVRGAPSAGPPARPRAGTGDLFGTSDAVVKFVMEGHDRGVNWAQFHPTQPLIVSGADDKTIKLWRMAETRAWEMDTLRGHTGNVSCVLFHPTMELVVSDSEDRSVRVWSLVKRVPVATFRREHDRYWMLAAHPGGSLLAAGHDSGMQVFKLQRERPPFALGQEPDVYYLKDRYLRRAKLGESSDVPLMGIRRAADNSFGAGPRSMVRNPFATGEDSLLVMTGGDGHQYELYQLKSPDSEPAAGTALSVAFTARNRFVVLERGRQMVVRSLENSEVRRAQAPYANADKLFQCSISGRVLVRGGDRLGLYEVASRRMLGELVGVTARHVVWSPDNEYLAVLAKNSVVVVDKNLNKIGSVTEAVRVKSAAWSSEGVLVYSTATHIKYVVLQHGSGDDAPGANASSPAPRAVSVDSGVLRSIDAVVYVVSVLDSSLFVLDRSARLRTLRIDLSEPRFKLALAAGRFTEVLAIIESGKLSGAAVVTWLRRQGFPEVALAFADDAKTKFDLAVECGDLDVAAQAASDLDEPEAWGQLAHAALLQGNVEIAERTMARLKQLDKLTFLYAVTGNVAGLQRVLEDASRGEDPDSLMTQFHAALLIGDARARIQILEKAGQIVMAYITAVVHGLDEDAARFAKYLQDAQLPVPDTAALVPEADSKMLGMRPPVAPVQNWPLLPISRNVMDAAKAEEAANARQAAAATFTMGGADAGAGAGASEMALDAWGDDLDLGLGLQEEKPAASPAAAAGGMDGLVSTNPWGADDLDLDLDLELPAGGAGVSTAGAGGLAVPKAGTPAAVAWLQASAVPADAAAAGAFEKAGDLLNRQVGLVAMQPLTHGMQAARQAAVVYVPGVPGAPSIAVPLQRAAGEDGSAVAALPVALVTLPRLAQLRASVFSLFAAGKFADASQACDQLFAAIPLAVANSRSEALQIDEFVDTAREYKLAVMLEAARKATGMDTPEGQARSLELASYMTHCTLESQHKMLTLNLAMSLSFKLKNFISAANFARRLLDEPQAAAAGAAPLVAKARKVLTVAEQQGRNAMKLAHEGMGAWDLCAGSLQPLPRGTAVVRAPLSRACYGASFAGSVCAVDGMSKVGEETLGLVSIPAAAEA